MRAKASFHFYSHNLNEKFQWEPFPVYTADLIFGLKVLIFNKSKDTHHTYH